MCEDALNMLLEVKLESLHLHSSSKTRNCANFYGYQRRPYRIRSFIGQRNLSDPFFIPLPQRSQITPEKRYKTYRIAAESCKRNVYLNV